LGASLGHDWQVFNCGHSSWTTTQLLANFAEVQSHLSLHTPNNTLIVNEIGNEIDQGVSEATARANMQALIAKGRSSGWRVLFATTPPRDAAHFSAAQTLAVNNINAYFRANPAEHDGLIEWAADPLLDDPNDLAIYPDGVHPSATGAARMAALAQAAL
jgi:lysophospholipase L1-like esterase